MAFRMAQITKVWREAVIAERTTAGLDEWVSSLRDEDICPNCGEDAQHGFCTGETCPLYAKQGSKRKFYKTTYTITVLSEDEPCTSMSLSDIDQLISHGGNSGQVTRDTAQLLTSKEVVNALLDQESDPGFFRLDADGNDLED